MSDIVPFSISEKSNDQLALETRECLSKHRADRATFPTRTMTMASNLLDIRMRLKSDIEFSTFLKSKNLGLDQISRNDRAALMNMARHPKEAFAVLELTGRSSWRHIWKLEISPLVYDTNPTLGIQSGVPEVSPLATPHKSQITSTSGVASGDTSQITSTSDAKALADQRSKTLDDLKTKAQKALETENSILRARLQARSDREEAEIQEDEKERELEKLKFKLEIREKNLQSREDNFMRKIDTAEQKNEELQEIRKLKEDMEKQKEKAEEKRKFDIAVNDERAYEHFWRTKEKPLKEELRKKDELIAQIFAEKEEAAHKAKGTCPLCGNKRAQPLDITE